MGQLSEKMGFSGKEAEVLALAQETAGLARLTNFNHVYTRIN